MTYRAHRSGRCFVLPEASADEAALVRDATVFSAQSLLEVFAHLSGRKILPRRPPASTAETFSGPDMQDVKGQLQAKRALEIVAAGGHSILMIGPPGTGKTQLARSIGGLVDLPVVEFRIAALMNSLLGETERRFAQAFATLEAMSPNVVFIDGHGSPVL